MAGTIHGNIDCLLGGNLPKEQIHRAFKKTFDFLETLTGSNVITRIAYNTGSVGGGLTGSGTDDDDGANPWGKNAWALFRFNTSSVRTWEWYFLMQFTSASGNFGDAPGNPGLINGAAETQTGNEASWAISMATMLTTGGISVSPWNGTTNNDGTDTKGNPVWETGIASDTLAVLPRSNNAGGSHDTSRENMAELYNHGQTSHTPRFHILSDDDGLLFACASTNTFYTVSYCGAYHPRTEISAANFTPLVMIARDMDTIDMLTTGETFGSLNGDNIAFEGGIVVSGGVRLGRIARYDVNWHLSTTFQPNTALGAPLNDVFSVPLIAYEAPNFGHVGYIETPIYQEIYNVANNSENSDLTRVVLGASTSDNALKIYTAWDGSSPAPGSGTARSGTLF